MMQAARQLSAETYIGGADILFPARRIKQGEFSFAKFFVSLVVIFSLLFIHVYQQALVAQNAVEMAELKEDIRQQKTTNEKLKVRDMVLQSPGRLEQIAAANGMIKPEKVNYIMLPVDYDKKEKSASGKRGILASLQGLWQRAKSLL